MNKDTMKRYLALAVFAVACTTAESQPTALVNAENQVQSTETTKTMTSFYDLKAQTIDGQNFDFSSLKGKRVLIVNVASRCGYTPQYEGLQELHEKFAGEEFVILGFPSNDFGGQEPGSELEIKSFCSANYGVTFQMMSKVETDAKSGHPVYQWLCQEALNGKGSADVSWNFNKFLIDEEGNWVKHLPSRVKPMSEEITTFAQGK